MARAANTDDVDGSCFVTKSPAGDQVDALCVSSSTASCLPRLPLHRPPPKDLRLVNCSAGAHPFNCLLGLVHKQSRTARPDAAWEMAAAIK